jgi:lipopolysaccharide export system protein LptA
VNEQSLRFWTRASAVGLLALAAAFGASATGAQEQKTSPFNFEHKRDQPVRIQAATLEVRDKEKKATFSGNVHVIQGETDLRCNTLIVYYDNEKDKPKPKSKLKSKSKAPPSSSGNQQIRRMEASGNVVVTQKEQTVTADRGDFDMRTNSVTLTGNVVVSRGKDVLRGQRLVVDLTTGVSRMESGGGRVEGLFQSKSGQGQGPLRPARTN